MGDWIKEHGWLSLPLFAVGALGRALLKRTPSGGGR